MQPTYQSANKDNQQKSKAEAAAEFKCWLRTLPAADIVLYTDGSQLRPNATGYGYVAYQGTNKLVSGKGRLGAAEVYDAEAEGARHGLQAVLDLPAIQSVTRIHVCLDNTAVIQGLLGGPASSSQEAFLDFQQHRHGDVMVHWVPGHQGIKGNKEADSLVKEEVAIQATPYSIRDQTNQQGHLATLRPRPTHTNNNKAI